MRALPLRHAPAAFVAAVVLATMGCEGGLQVAGERTDEDDPAPEEETPRADVLRVRVSGEPKAYVLRVTVESPDEDCEQYADWWEVLRPDGTLVYRRILHHSHKNEQPFTREGGPVEAEPEDRLFVRAHMKPGGYGGQAMAGTAKGGFERTDLPPDFAADVEGEEPQPRKCLF